MRSVESSQGGTKTSPVLPGLQGVAQEAGGRLEHLNKP
jgi:hypothetical protein